MASSYRIRAFPCRLYKAGRMALDLTESISFNESSLRPGRHRFLRVG